MDKKPLVNIFNKNIPVTKPPPIWLMRQAGRYLPQYRKLRKQAGDFLKLCYTPELATQITLEPVERFDLDGAIVFADILLIPHALGQRLEFKEGIGPCLEALQLSNLHNDALLKNLAPVFDTIAGVKSALPQHVALLGFCGAPWTVASYMIAGGSDAGQRKARQFLQTQPKEFETLMSILVDASAQYLLAQYRAGADILQIFDSWAASLTGDAFERYCTKPVAQIIAAIRAKGCSAPILVFPKSMQGDSLAYAKGVAADGLSISHDMDMAAIAQQAPADLVLQGNLAPQMLLADEHACQDAIDTILTMMQSRRHIFNLGHGILPETSPARVAALIRQVRGA